MCLTNFIDNTATLSSIDFLLYFTIEMPSRPGEKYKLQYSSHYFSYPLKYIKP